MNLSNVPTWSLLAAWVCAAGVRAEDSPPQSLQDSFSGRRWATVAPDQGGYQLRLLTDEEKKEAERTLQAYRQSLGRGTAAEDSSTAAYRRLPADVRSGQFYQLRRLAGGAIELKSSEVTAILPSTSVRIQLLGPTGTLDQGSNHRSASPTPQAFFQALRGGGDIGSRRLGSSAAPGRGRGATLGAGAGGEPRDKTRDLTPRVFLLQYADAGDVIRVIEEMFADLDIRVAIEPRLNAVVVRGAPQTLEQIQQLTESLDRQTPDTRAEPAQARTLELHSIEGLDPELVLQVLKTLMSGQRDLRLDFDPGTNRVIAFGRAADHETIREAIQQLQPAP